MSAERPHWRRVLRDGASAAPLLDLAAAEGWPRIADEPRRHYDSRRLTWSAGADVQVHLLESYPLGLRTVVVTGEHRGPVTGRVEALLDFRTTDEIYAGVASDDAREVLSSFYALTELSRELAEDPRTSVAYQRVLEHPEMVVRAAALRLAAGYRSRPGLREALAARRAVETELAELVDEMLSYLDEEEED